jgi:PAS domain S-box-containing protein
MRAGPTLDVVALVHGAGDPAFAVDATRTIVAWNRAAERLLGIPAQDAVGRSCAQVVAARDSHGRPLCGALCPVLAAMHRREPLPTVEAHVDCRDGPALWVAMSTFISVDGAPCAVHLLRDITTDVHRRAFIQQVLQQAGALCTDRRDAGGRAPPVVLSPRQTSVLRLLASGAGTKAIARALGISPATVRNHIQQIMTALGAHSRLEAVVRALQRGLL